MAWPCGDGRDDVAGGLLDPGGDVRVGLCGQPQVVGGVAQRRMTHIRLQDRQQRADVLTLSEPETEIVDREGVPQVMNAGTVAPPTVGDTRSPEEPAEVLVDVPDRQRQAAPAGEEPAETQIYLRRTADELGVVVGEPDPQRLGDGNLPILAALGVADLQHSGVDVDIARTQQTSLAQPQAAGV